MKMELLAAAPSDADDLPRERLLIAAQHLFCRYGVQGTGVARVLKEAGVSRKTLYERFRSKDELVRAVLEREGQEWRTWLSQGVNALGGKPKQRLLGVFDLLETWFSEDTFYGCAFINTVAEHDKITVPIADSVRRHRALTDEILLEIAREAGAADPQKLVRALSLLIDGAIVTAMIERSPATAAEARNIAAIVIEAHCR